MIYDFDLSDFFEMILILIEIFFSNDFDNTAPLFSNLTYLSLDFSERQSDDGFIRSYRNFQQFKTPITLCRLPFSNVKINKY